MDRTRKFTVRKQNKWFQDWLDTAVGIVLGLPAEYRLPQWRFSCCLILQYYVSRRASVLLGIIRKEGWGLSCDLMHWLDAWTRVTRQQLTGSLVKESCRSIALNLRFAKQMAAILQCYWSHSRKWPINRCQKKPVIWNATTNLVSWKSKSIQRIAHGGVDVQRLPKYRLEICEIAHSSQWKVKTTLAIYTCCH